MLAEGQLTKTRFKELRADENVYLIGLDSDHRDDALANCARLSLAALDARCIDDDVAEGLNKATNELTRGAFHKHPIKSAKNFYESIQTRSAKFVDCLNSIDEALRDGLGRRLTDIGDQLTKIDPSLQPNTRALRQLTSPEKSFSVIAETLTFRICEQISYRPVTPESFTIPLQFLADRDSSPATRDRCRQLLGRLGHASNEAVDAGSAHPDLLRARERAIEALMAPLRDPSKQENAYCVDPNLNNLLSFGRQGIDAVLELARQHKNDFDLLSKVFESLRYVCDPRYRDPERAGYLNNLRAAFSTHDSHPTALDEQRLRRELLDLGFKYLETKGLEGGALFLLTRLAPENDNVRAAAAKDKGRPGSHLFWSTGLMDDYKRLLGFE